MTDFEIVNPKLWLVKLTEIKAKKSHDLGIPHKGSTKFYKKAAGTAEQ